MAKHRKAILNLPKIGMKEIGSYCFEPGLMWDLLYLNRGYIDLWKWFEIIPERFHDEALKQAYLVSQMKTFKRRIANVRMIEYFIVVFYRRVEASYNNGTLSVYGWLVSEFQSVEQKELVKSWDRKVYCKSYSRRWKAPKIALRKRMTFSGLKLRKSKRKKRMGSEKQRYFAETCKVGNRR